VLARQGVLPLEPFCQPFFLLVISIGFVYAWAYQTRILLYVLLSVAGMTGMYHHVLFFFSIGVMNSGPTPPPALFVKVFLELGSHELLAGAGFKL
jgi:hypothetical protein